MKTLVLIVIGLVLVLFSLVVVVSPQVSENYFAHVEKVESLPSPVSTPIPEQIVKFNQGMHEAYLPADSRLGIVAKVLIAVFVIAFLVLLSAHFFGPGGLNGILKNLRLMTKNLVSPPPPPPPAQIPPPTDIGKGWLTDKSRRN